jgi:hypothetical protein
MVRAFKEFTIVAGGTPQPLIGTTTTAAFGPVGYPTGQIGSGALATIPVADSSMFLNKDYLVIGKPSSTNPVEQRLLIMAIPSSTSIQVQVPLGGIPATYGSGTYVRLSNVINSTYVQTIAGNAGSIYIGTRDNMVKASYTYVIALLAAVASGQPTEFRDGRSGAWDPDDIGNYWIDGTTGDGYLPSYGAV